MSSDPFVSIIIPMRNEERQISKCLDSVIAQDYLKNKMEVLVINGMSTDKSKEIVSAYEKQHPYIKIVDNSKGIIAAGLNVGLRKSKGEIIIRMDVHAYYHPDYISQCVWHLLHTEATNVGGPIISVGSSFVGHCIAHAISSKFGVGGAVFRYGYSEQFVETVFPGAWRRETLVNLGGWNEEWIINEDQELNARILEEGGKILLTSKIRLIYYCRNSVVDLIRQYFRYANSRPKTFRAHPGVIRPSHLAPPIFVGMLFLFAVSWFLGPEILRISLALIVGLYLLCDIVASIVACKRDLLCIPLVLLLFPTLHISWGLGFYVGMYRFGIPWKAFIAAVQKIFRSLIILDFA